MIDSDAPLQRQRDLIAALMRDPATLGAGGASVELLETHISFVLLAGDAAYKIKKPLDLGFLDFGTLEKRRFYCEEELRLNRRLAPALYLEVVAFGGDAQQPALDASSATGSVIEYAVKMRRFEQDGLFDQLLARGELTAQHIDALARKVADFHERIARLPGDAHANPETSILAPAMQNVEQLRPLLHDPAELATLDALAAWTQQEFARQREFFAARQHQGFVRECHGDLHLGNVTLIDGAVTVFDGIEFSPLLRWIDAINEASFLVMDLIAHERADLAWRWLNAWLELNGDYAGVRLLRFYLVYRAMVRAKVAGIRAAQAEIDAAEKNAQARNCARYLALAEAFSKSSNGAVIIGHGVSGSGKTTGSQALLEKIGAIRIRSDVERKRLHQMSALTRPAESESGLYTAQTTQRTYQHLLELTRAVVEAGYPAMVDATFLQRDYRYRFRQLASKLQLPYVILDFAAEAPVLRARVAQRRQSGADASDADLAVLEQQLANQEPLAADEMTATISVDTSRAEADAAMLAERIKPSAHI